eukprot:m.542438 g.542438  ORF g.542438 m.542438 type:complete len:101 (+) comp57656_c0_seq29:1196-1498(+)
MSPMVILCQGNYHLAWSVPMADPTYVIPGAAIHSFCMFAPFFALYEKRGMVVQGIFLFVFGPYLASWVSGFPSLLAMGDTTNNPGPQVHTTSSRSRGHVS